MDVIAFTALPDLDEYYFRRAVGKLGYKVAHTAIWKICSIGNTHGSVDHWHENHSWPRQGSTLSVCTYWLMFLDRQKVVIDVADSVYYNVNTVLLPRSNIFHAIKIR